MSDLISRQAAIDVVRSECRCGEQMDLIEELKTLPSAQPYTEAEIQKMQELEQAELQKAYECGRASAQPEIIRCKECKHHSHDAGYGYDWCNRTSGVFRVKPEDFCSRAERRTDE